MADLSLSCTSLSSDTDGCFISKLHQPQFWMAFISDLNCTSTSSDTDGWFIPDLNCTSLSSDTDGWFISNLNCTSLSSDTDGWFIFHLNCTSLSSDTDGWFISKLHQPQFLYTEGWLINISNLHQPVLIHKANIWHRHLTYGTPLNCTSEPQFWYRWLIYLWSKLHQAQFLYTKGQTVSQPAQPLVLTQG